MAARAAKYLDERIALSQARREQINTQREQAQRDAPLHARLVGDRLLMAVSGQITPTEIVSGS